MRLPYRKSLSLPCSNAQGEPLSNECYTGSGVRKFTSTLPAKFSLDDCVSLFNGVLLHLYHIEVCSERHFYNGCIEQENQNSERSCYFQKQKQPAFNIIIFLNILPLIFCNTWQDILNQINLININMVLLILLGPG